MTVCALLLAAGESTRMGDLKALLEWRGRPLIQHQIDELLAGGCAEVVVVLGHEADRIRARLPADPRVRSVLNPEYRSGRSSSIRTGLGAVDPAAAGALILGVDQPTDRSIIAALIAGHLAAGAPVSVPARSGQRGHPPLFSRTLFAEVLAIDEATEGLKRVVRSHEAEINRVECDSPLISVNLNRPEDYAAARDLSP